MNDINAWCCYFCAYLFTYGITRCNDGITSAAMFGIIALTFIRFFSIRSNKLHEKDRVDEYIWYLRVKSWQAHQLGEKTTSINMEELQNLIDLLKDVKNELPKGEMQE